MRTIKFRVWNEAKNKYIYDYKIGDYATSDGCINLNDLFKPSGSIKKEIIEQFTGFTDSEGVDVYEGDILFMELPEGNLPVEFKNGQWVAGEQPLYLWYEIRVIGNCHETKQKEG